MNFVADTDVVTISVFVLNEYFRSFDLSKGL